MTDSSYQDYTILEAIDDEFIGSLFLQLAEDRDVTLSPDEISEEAYISLPNDLKKDIREDIGRRWEDYIIGNPLIDAVFECLEARQDEIKQAIDQQKAMEKERL